MSFLFRMMCGVWMSAKKHRRMISTRARTSQPVVEQLEDRAVPTIYTVTGVGDGPGVVAPVKGKEGEFTATTLRAAIVAINAEAGNAQDTINFDIGKGLQIISLKSALPAINHSVIIDGTSQPKAAGKDTGPQIELNGATIGGFATNNGLVLEGGSSVVKGLSIVAFSGNGIVIKGAAQFGNNTVVGDYIGLEPDGSTISGNKEAGVLIDNSTNNLIGGTTQAQGKGVLLKGSNVISGNGGAGVLVTGSGSIGNQIQGNFIGTDAKGESAKGNKGAAGIVVQKQASATLIGVDTTATLKPKLGQGNLISANVNGILIEDSKSNEIQGNLIGTDRTGSKGGVTLGNGANGIEVTTNTDLILGASDNNQIGGFPVSNGVLVGNVISNNKKNGILISGASHEKVYSNLIGTGINGNETGLGNQLNGVAIRHGVVNAAISQTDQASFNVIGGDDTLRNIISGNGDSGVSIVGSDDKNATAVDQNEVSGNYIGVDSSGKKVLANGRDGVDVVRATNTTIGGKTDGKRNIIVGGDSGAGVDIDGIGLRENNQGSENVVRGNYIGTDVSGMIPLGTASAGVHVENGTDNAEVIGNVIAATQFQKKANGKLGQFANGVVLSDAKNDIIRDNIIGLNAAGDRTNKAFGNLGNGISLSLRSTSNLITGNVIGFSGLNGIRDRNPAHSNTFSRNEIFSSGALGIDVDKEGITDVSLPVLTSAVVTGDTVTITGSLTTAVAGPFVIQFFLNDKPGTKGAGEGAYFIGESDPPVAGKGAQFTFSFLASGHDAFLPSGKYEVLPGMFISATATIAGAQGNANKGTAEFSQDVKVTIAGKGNKVGAIEGQPSGAVDLADFTDPTPNAAPGDYTATVNWADGTITAAQVVSTSPGSFEVLGEHTYQDEGTYSDVITILASGGRTGTFDGTIAVADAPLATTAVPFTPSVGSPFTGSVAHFTDLNPFATVADFEATIDWGNGATSSGTIVASASGGFDVLGTNTYSSTGSFAYSVNITDVGGSIANAGGAVQVGISFLYNTGTDSTHNATAQGVVDAHYTLTDFTPDSGQPPATVGPATYAEYNSRYIADTMTSNWITASPDAYSIDPVGTYTWTTTAVVPSGIDPNTLVVSGRWSTDNEGVDILVNGVSSGNAIPSTLSYQSWTDFTLSGPWHAGINTISFVVHNDLNGPGLANPAGLRVEFTGINVNGPAAPEATVSADLGAGPALVAVGGSSSATLAGFSQNTVTQLSSQSLPLPDPAVVHPVSLAFTQPGSYWKKSSPTDILSDAVTDAFWDRPLTTI